MSKSRIAPELMARFGLVGRVESRRVILPLKGVECNFSARGGLVEVSMTQIFRQEFPRPLDCVYQFPLPADASVYACEADINGRIIRATVMERNEARQVAAREKAAGHRTALVEAERDNLFTLMLTNLQPDDLILVCLKYVQPLRHLAHSLAVEIPLCPGVRYIPGQFLLRANSGKGTRDDTDQVPDASRISPPRIDAEHPDAAYIEVRGELDGLLVEPGSVNSPSHAIVTGKNEDDSFAISLLSKGDVPDRNFVVRWNERGGEEVLSRAWLNRAAGETYALIEVRAPDQTQADPQPLDFYFLLDRSGSMDGQKWVKAVEALHSCVDLLGPG